MQRIIQENEEIKVALQTYNEITQSQTQTQVQVQVQQQLGQMSEEIIRLNNLLLAKET